MDFNVSILNPAEWGRAFCRHACLATFREEIARGTEEYRRQIAVRDEWLHSQEKNLKRISELELEKLKKENEQAVAASHEEAKTWQERANFLVPLYIEAATRIAISSKFHPLDWEATKNLFSPQLRGLVDSMRANIPDPPRQPSLATQGVRLRDVLGKPGK